MGRRVMGLFVFLALIGALVAGCASNAPAETATDAAETVAETAQTGSDVALKVTGKVNAETGWTEDEVKAMNTLTVQSTNKDGEAADYTGVLISELVTLAGPAADAATIVFVADDGYTAESPLADVMGCADCIVSFREQGGFSTVLPNMGGKLQVKGVVEIQVK